MNNKNTIIKGVAALALVAGLVSISSNTKTRSNVGFSIGVGSPGYYGYPYYGYGNCRYVDTYVDADGVEREVVRYRPCGGYAPAVGFGVGYWGGRRYYGRRRWHRGHRGHRGHHGHRRHGGHRRR